MHTNAAGVSTHYVAEGDPIPVDLPDEVVLVGPGSGEETEDDAAAKAKASKPAAKAAQKDKKDS